MQTEKTPNPREFVAAVGAEKRAVEDFIALLESERDALIRCETERVMALAGEKSGLVQRLSQCLQQRNRMLKDCGLPARSPDFERWLERTPVARSLWNELRALGRRAAEANRLNGTLIGTRLAQVGRALMVLQSACGGAVLYGPDGTPRARLPSSSVWAA